FLLAERFVVAAWDGAICFAQARSRDSKSGLRRLSFIHKNTSCVAWQGAKPGTGAQAKGEDIMSNQIGRRALMGLSAMAVATAMLGGTTAAYAADVTIPVIVKDTTSFYWQIVLAGARQAGKDLGVKVPELGAQSESDINGEINILENAVAGKPAAIVIAPTEFKALGAPITEAAKSVPIIGIDSAADSKAFTSFLTTDNVNGGRIAADGLAAAIKEKTGAIKGDVAIITSLPGVGSLSQRDQGFKEQIAAKYPDLHIIADRVADGQATTGLNITTDLLTANPDLVGIFADNLIMGQGSGQAIAENGVASKVALVSFDSDDKTLGFLDNGTTAALVVQDPYRMGYDGVKTALAVSKGEKVPANVDTGANLVTKANENDPKIAALIHPKV
ncbi:MAG TPA: ABC transporter substrate-binding protein, partial [Thermomicrobiales bacterium]|nr:ABC transporter substrate-binding protein [Thermomicrobiales bacterium]